MGDLEFGGRIIKQINELFAERVDNLALVSFWESRNTPVVGVKSVISSLISREL